MHKIAVHVCSWKSPELLAAFIPRFLASSTEDTNLKIVLNESDPQSIEICREYKVNFIAIDKNLGTLAVDLLIPSTNAEYVLQSNNDMYFSHNWEKKMLEAIENNGPCSVSASLIEPRGSGNSVVIVDNLGEFTEQSTYDKFIDKTDHGEYKLPNQVSYMHPMLTKFSDLKKIGGYSDNFDMGFHPGWSLDDDAPFRLYKLYNKNFKFITLGNCFVYHGISMTNNKLSPELRAKNGINRFIEKNGCHWLDFKREIGVGQSIEIN